MDSSFWYSKTFRRFFCQLIFVFILACCAYFLLNNMTGALHQRGLEPNYYFLNDTAGFDIGAFASRISGLDASLIGAEVRYQIMEDGLTTPSVALRLSGSKITGISQVNLSTVAVDAMISKKLTFITPYIGIGSVRIASAPKVGLLQNVSATDSRVFVGVNMNFLTTNFALEAEKLGSVSSISGKIGFRF